MLDFTSSLYLGMRHESASLGGWSQLTTGVPPALGAPAGSHAVAARIAALQGVERAVLFPSTLHALWDLCDALCREGRERVAIFVDAGTYVIAAHGVERARLRGVTVEAFSHHAPRALAARLAQRGTRERPVVVTDGFCPGCGRSAPLADYVEIARRHGGRLVVDDTQALGVFGEVSPTSAYGTGGGGSLVRARVAGDDVLAVASMAKAFGAPLAVLSGGRRVVAPFERSGTTRVHASGISSLALRAAEHALDENDACGDALRERLLANVRRFRAGLEDVSAMATQGLFPVQAPAEMEIPVAADVRAALRREGVRCVLLKGGCGGASTLARVGFVLRATMDRYAVDAGVAALRRALTRYAAVARYA